MMSRVRMTLANIILFIEHAVHCTYDVVYSLTLHSSKSHSCSSLHHLLHQTLFQ